MEYGVSVMVNPTPLLTARSEDSLWRPVSLGGGWGWENRAKSGVKVSARTAMGYPPLWRAINLISASVAGLPFDVFKRDSKGGKKVDLRHPAQQLLDRSASPYMNAYTFKKTMTALAILHGNAYASIDRINGVPVAMSIWNPQNTLVRMYDGELWYVTYVDNEPVKVRGADMLHIRGLGPDGLCGYAVLDLMADALGVGMAAQEFGSRFFGEGTNTSGLLMIPGHFSDEKIRNTLSAWQSMNAGLKNSHKVALLQDGVKFQQLQIDPDKAQFLQTREHEIRATVANITGVPPHMLGDATRTSHNSLEAEGQSYLDYTLQPWLQIWEAECADKLLTAQQRESDSRFIEFNREALVQMTFRDKIEGIYRQTEMGLLDINEGRALLNYAPLAEKENKRYHPANWVEVGMEPNNVTGQPAPRPQDAQMANVVRKLVSTSVTKSLELESSKAIQLAARANNFVSAVDEFYTSWSDRTLSEFNEPEVRRLVQEHVEASKSALLDAAGSSTTDNLKTNVAEVVATWDARAESLIDSVMKVVQK